MAQSNVEAVRAFHAKMGIPMPDRPTVPDMDVLEYRLKFMQEELDEFILAMEQHRLGISPLCQSYHANNQLDVIEGMADALVDLVYVALGTALLMGLPWEPLFNEVQRANISKERAQSAEHSLEETGRGHSFDVVKPAGWQPPNIAGILADYGFMPKEYPR